MRSMHPVPKGMSQGCDMETTPSFILNHIVHKYHQILQSRLRSAGVSTLQMRIILALHAHDRLTVGGLCNYAIAEQPTMSRALDSLEAHGLVRRETSDSDSRLRLISLTDAGTTLHDNIFPVVVSLNEAMVADMADEQRQSLVRNLSTVLVNLERL